MKTVIAAAVAAAAVSGPVPDISSLNPEALKAMIPETIPWRTGPSGNATATLFGDQSKPGFYVVMNRFQPGTWDQPHYHAYDRYILILSGTWWVDTGMTYDPEKRTVPLKAGTFVVHPARQIHYDGVRPGSGEVTMMVFGQGPGARIECMGPTADTGPGPCADAKAREAK
jgi:mannose-6-phosphate isomerase-like protein (cupin superfamily)